MAVVPATNKSSTLSKRFSKYVRRWSTLALTDAEVAELAEAVGLDLGESNDMAISLNALKSASG